MLHCWVDGSVTGGAWGKKTGPKTVPRNYIGWVVRKPTGEFLAHHSFYVGEKEGLTGNTAEEFAVSSVLRWLIRNGYQDQAILIHSDSQLTCGHLNGNFAVNEPTLKRYVESNQALMARFPSVRMKWIRREENRYADFMSKVFQEKYGAPGIPEREVPPDVIAKHR